MTKWQNYTELQPLTYIPVLDECAPPLIPAITCPTPARQRTGCTISSTQPRKITVAAQAHLTHRAHTVRPHHQRHCTRLPCTLLTYARTPKLIPSHARCSCIKVTVHHWSQACGTRNSPPYLCSVWCAYPKRAARLPIAACRSRGESR